MQPTLYSDDSTSSSKHLIPVVHLTVVSCSVRVSSPNGESGIGKAVVCNTWRLTVTSPLIRHPLPSWLWVYEAGELHSGSNEVWTTGRICDHSHHRICMASHFISHNQTRSGYETITCVNIWQFFYYNSSIWYKQHPVQLHLDKSLPHLCRGDSWVAQYYPCCTVPGWIQFLYNKYLQKLIHSPLQSNLQLPLQSQ